MSVSRPQFVLIPLGLVVLAALFAAGCAHLGRVGRSSPSASVIVQQMSGTDAQLIGLDVVSDDVVWVAGVAGTYAWTIDGGATWHTGTVPGADTLQFRDVHAESADVVSLLSIGPGAASRIYRTEDRGAVWNLVFESGIEEAFYDCFDFWPDGAGLVFSDAVQGSFPIARTERGRAWTVLPPQERPSALLNEGGFAASGTCLVTIGDSTALIGTGNADRARVLRTDDRGRTWSGHAVPIASGEAAGITTLAFSSSNSGVALGGDLTRSDATHAKAARTVDGGRTWREAASPAFPGAVYGSTYVPGGDVLIAVGPGGAAYTRDHADTWEVIDTLSYWSVDAAGPAAVWAVGPQGRVARIEFGDE